jgi:hypothetical protein
MGDLGTYKDIVYLNYRGRPFEIGLTVIDSNKTAKPDNSFLDPSFYWETKDNTFINIKLSYKYRSVRRELILEASELRKDNHLILSTRYSDDTERQIITSIFGKEVPAATRSSLARYLRMRNFIPSISLLIDSEKILNDFLKSSNRISINKINNFVNFF